MFSRDVKPLDHVASQTLKRLIRHPVQPYPTPQNVTKHGDSAGGTVKFKECDVHYNKAAKIRHFDGAIYMPLCHQYNYPPNEPQVFCLT